MTNYVVFDLETVPDLDIARRLLNLGADVPNEEVRSAIGQKYARPDQVPREIFLKPHYPDERLNRSALIPFEL